MLDIPKRDRVAERREATRREILDAAWVIARESGLATLTLRDIASRVGMQAPFAVLPLRLEERHLRRHVRAGVGGVRGLRTRPRTGPGRTIPGGHDQADGQALLRLCGGRSRPVPADESTRPVGFEPSAESFAPSVRVVERSAELVRAAGVSPDGPPPPDRAGEWCRQPAPRERSRGTHVLGSSRSSRGHVGRQPSVFRPRTAPRTTRKDRSMTTTSPLHPPLRPRLPTTRGHAPRQDRVRTDHRRSGRPQPPATGSAATNARPGTSASWRATWSGWRPWRPTRWRPPDSRRSPPPRRRLMAGPVVDSLTALQVRERDGLRPAEVVRAARRIAPQCGARGRRFTPGLIRRRALPDIQVVNGHEEVWTVGYLLDVILTRDPWMHRIDIARAIGRDRIDVTADHDGVIVDDVVQEWAARHGRPYRLELTGSSRWPLGRWPDQPAETPTRSPWTRSTSATRSRVGGPATGSWPPRFRSRLSRCPERRTSWRLHRPSRDVTVMSDAAEVPGIGFLPVNTFVLHAEQPVVVDTGLSTPDKDFVTELSRVIDPADVRWIWLTHPDRDHTGGLWQLLEAAPQARLITTFIGVGIMSTEWAGAPRPRPPAQPWPVAGRGRSAASSATGRRRSGGIGWRRARGLRGPDLTPPRCRPPRRRSSRPRGGPPDRRGGGAGSRSNGGRRSHQNRPLERVASAAAVSHTIVSAPSSPERRIGRSTLEKVGIESEIPGVSAQPGCMLCTVMPSAAYRCAISSVMVTWIRLVRA